MNVLLRSASLVTLAFVLVGCNMLPLFTSGTGTEPEAVGDDPFPEIIGVQLVSSGDRVYDVVVSISSPYDSPERYADGWRVLDEEGNVLGTHTLMHDHANEQPFTRTQPGLEIPE